MDKRTPQVEWQIAESDAEWEALRRQAAPVLPPRRTRWLPLLLLGVVCLGSWLWLRPVERSPAAVRATVPPAADWGAAETLTTTHFTMHFYPRDRAAVTTVTPQLEQFYTALQADLGVSDEGTPPLAIRVNTTRTLASEPFRPRLATTIESPSPTLYPTTTWRADEVLMQALVFPLIDHSLALAVQHYRFTPARYPLLGGIRLWRLWHGELPLAEGHRALIHWIYVALPARATTTQLPLPVDYEVLCENYQLWMRYPVQVQVPLLCEGKDESPRRLSYTMIRHAPDRLPPLDTPTYPDEELDASGQRTVINHPGYAIAVATLLDYVEQAYGRAALPQLIAAWGSGATWPQIAPALFGVSATDFEQGWQRFLAEESRLAVE